MRRTLLYLISFLALIASFFRPLHAQSAGQNENARFKVEGVVVNSVTGKPIPRALVQIAGRPQSSAHLTGSRGEFSFQSLPAGQILISAAKPGFLNKGNGSYG